MAKSFLRNLQDIADSSTKLSAAAEQIIAQINSLATCLTFKDSNPQK